MFNQVLNLLPMHVRVKKLDPNAVIPEYAHPGTDAGMDMTAISVNYTDDYIEYDTGIAMEIPKGYVGLLFPRSSNSKMDLLLANSVGVVDSSYRGSVRFRFKRILRKCKSYTKQGEDIIGYTEYLDSPIKYEMGDKVGQIIILPYPQIQFIESETLSETDRGEGGFGSSGK